MHFVTLNFTECDFGEFTVDNDTCEDGGIGTLIQTLKILLFWRPLGQF